MGLGLIVNNFYIFFKNVTFKRIKKCIRSEVTRQNIKIGDDVVSGYPTGGGVTGTDSLRGFVTDENFKEIVIKDENILKRVNKLMKAPDKGIMKGIYQEFVKILNE